MRNVKSGYFLYIFWQGLGVGWLSSDSDSRLRLPSFSDSRLFPPKKPTNSRLLRGDKFLKPKKSRKLEVKFGSRESVIIYRLPTPYPQKSTDSRLLTPKPCFLGALEAKNAAIFGKFRICVFVTLNLGDETNWEFVFHNFISLWYIGPRIEKDHKGLKIEIMLITVKLEFITGFWKHDPSGL